LLWQLPTLRLVQFELI